MYVTMFLHRHWATDWRVIGVSSQAPTICNNEAVPFRLTPNMQRFMGPLLLDGLLAMGIMTIGRCLTEPEVNCIPSFPLARTEPTIVRSRIPSLPLREG